MKNKEQRKTTYNTMLITQNSKPASNYSKGITLISLVVTIVILLILAGITIVMLFSENGIIKKAQDAKHATENAVENENNAIGGINELIEKYLNGSNNLVNIIGKLDVTYEVVDSMVYFYPTIDGYNSIDAYCQGKIIPMFEEIDTEAEAEKFWRNYFSVWGGQTFETTEELLEKINSNGSNYTTCLEAFNERITEGIKEVEVDTIEILMVYFSQIYDELTTDEKDSLILYFLDFEEGIHFDTAQEFLNCINEDEETNYSTLNEALNNYQIIVGAGLLDAALGFTLEYPGGTVQLLDSFEDIFRTEDFIIKDIVLECVLTPSEESAYVIKNGIESSKAITIEFTGRKIWEGSIELAPLLFGPANFSVGLPVSPDKNYIVLLDVDGENRYCAMSAIVSEAVVGVGGKLGTDAILMVTGSYVYWFCGEYTNYCFVKALYECGDSTTYMVEGDYAVLWSNGWNLVSTPNTEYIVPQMVAGKIISGVYIDCISGSPIFTVPISILSSGMDCELEKIKVTTCDLNFISECQNIRNTILDLSECGDDIEIPEYFLYDHVNVTIYVSQEVKDKYPDYDNVVAK